MTDLKNTLLIIGGSIVVVLAVIFGLTRMSGTSTTSITSVDQQQLVDGARFVRDNGETKVSVVTFADIQCPSCKAAKESLKELETMPGVKYVVRHFPLPPNIHKHSLISAKAVEAGRVMGKGWEMMNLMFDKQTEWSGINKPERQFVEYAKSLGLDELKFEEAMNSNEVAVLVQTDASLANRLQLSGTPTIFVNGELVGAPFVMEKVKGILAKGQ
ncbi:hypothetical protein A2572_03100 [Candidatus Collierbacteria bacterium RIFOXYD1_FULL_40_9]|uniref:Thioredoxin-like fold domain-containing protein n=1 Tax=Candidatus Collierbacteria bacterium RIFOXYD1_FULL_40_9 TaxID=1817731 RepID=A0A1F5FWU6_9BACT|nr:MAG: hypothetical protein A2572_03100 [Candidatus Collierbacteria bacterium RIFOXYD1_FULL_40_9]